MTRFNLGTLFACGLLLVLTLGCREQFVYQGLLDARLSAERLTYSKVKLKLASIRAYGKVDTPSMAIENISFMDNHCSYYLKYNPEPTQVELFIRCRTGEPKTLLLPFVQYSSWAEMLRGKKVWIGLSREQDPFYDPVMRYAEKLANQQAKKRAAKDGTTNQRIQITLNQESPDWSPQALLEGSLSKGFKIRYQGILHGDFVAQ